MIKIKSSENYVCDDGVVITNASDLDLQPGEWPPVIELDNDVLFKDEHSFDEGDLVAVSYVAGTRRVLIYND
jgi:hypothetical protein